jgi:hypothetical protein
MKQHERSVDEARAIAWYVGFGRLGLLVGNPAERMRLGI